MTTRSTFRVGGIYQEQRQRAQIERLKDTPGVAAVEINLRSRTVTFVHDGTVTVDMIANALRRLDMKPSLMRAS